MIVWPTVMYRPRLAALRRKLTVGGRWGNLDPDGGVWGLGVYVHTNPYRYVALQVGPFWLYVWHENREGLAKSKVREELVLGRWPNEFRFTRVWAVKPWRVYEQRRGVAYVSEHDEFPSRWALAGTAWTYRGALRLARKINGGR